MAEAIETTLKELIVERLFLDLDPEEIEDETELAEYGVDSFLLLELIVAMEEIFEVKFDQADITTETLKSVRSLAELIRAKQQG
jgi:acyl carrier protein